MKQTSPSSTLVITDSFDRECFARVTGESKAFARVTDAGQRLYPHFAALCEDLFAVLFKLDIVLRPATECAPSAALSRYVIETFRSSAGYPEVHGRAQLDEEAAARAMLRVAEVLLGLLRREELLTSHEMLRLRDLDWAEEQRKEHEEALASAEALLEQAGERSRDALEDAKDELEEELAELFEVAEQRRRDAEEMLRGIPSEAEQSIRSEADSLPSRLEQQDEALREFGEQMGIPGTAAVQEKLDLGSELVDNRKLQLLAKMVGVFRQFALAERRRRPVRRAAEVHDVGRSADLARLLPSELVSLRHPVLGKLFRRSYVEHTLLSYELLTEGEAGRGPAVLCLDVSSSMQGPRELWAKAVALTLLELARRQRRAFRVLCFSAGPGSLTEFDLLAADNGVAARNPVAQADLVRFAAFFPGGGTDYQPPLSRAVDIIREDRKPRADIVFITDGESALEPRWLDGFLEDKARMGFKVYTILIDLAGRQTDTVERFSDHVASISELTAQSGRDLFLKF